MGNGPHRPGSVVQLRVVWGFAKLMQRFTASPKHDLRTHPVHRTNAGPRCGAIGQPQPRRLPRRRMRLSLMGPRLPALGRLGRSTGFPIGWRQPSRTREPQPTGKRSRADPHLPRPRARLDLVADRPQPIRPQWQRHRSEQWLTTIGMLRGRCVATGQISRSLLAPPTPTFLVGVGRT